MSRPALPSPTLLRRLTRLGTAPASLLAVTALAGACATTPKPSAETAVTAEAAPTAEAKPPVAVTLLALNDFHGNLHAPSSGVMVNGQSVPAGGVAHLAAHIAAQSEANPHTVVVAAGDLIGASPLVSALFHDEPTIEALGLSGLGIAAVGNHEFDRGTDELLRLVRGGCHPKAGCREGHTYAGARFQYLAANVRDKASGASILPSYEIREFGGVSVGFIGLTLEDTPNLVMPLGVAGVTFGDEVETINAAVAELRQKGIEAIVVLLHEGASPKENVQDINGCPEMDGPLPEIHKGIDPAVDVIVSGHTHQPYICRWDGRLVTSAHSYGRLLTRIDLTLDPKTNDVIAADARQVVVTQDVAPHPEVATLVATYEALSADVANRPVGRLTADLTRSPNDHGESVLGGLVADAQLEATAPEGMGGAQVAFMNPGGVRADLVLKTVEGQEPGLLTYRDLHAVQPFGNMLVTMTLTGAQIVELLEQQWVNQSRVRLLQPSANFTYGWRESAPVGARVDVASIRLSGKPLDLGASYRVTVNSFMAAGGDGFTVLTKGTDRLTGPNDLDVFVEFVRRHAPLKAHKMGRIERVKTGTR